MSDAETIVWIEEPWDSVRTDSYIKVVYPDGATIFGKLLSPPESHPEADIATIHLGGPLGTLPVDVRGSIVYVKG